MIITVEWRTTGTNMVNGGDASGMIAKESPVLSLLVKNPRASNSRPLLIGLLNRVGEWSVSYTERASWNSV
jgi:hypothetical protein